MLWGTFAIIGLLCAALSGSLGFKLEDDVINAMKAASGSLPIQIFQDSDPSDVTKLIEAKERAQRHITDNDIVARFAEEVHNPHNFHVPHVHEQEFIDNRSAFIKHLQYKPPNCGRPFDVFRLLEIVQDARRAEQRRLIETLTLAPECSLKNCNTGGGGTTKSCGKTTTKMMTCQNKLWNPNTNAQKDKQSKEPIKERPVSNVVQPEEPSLSEPRTKAPSQPLSRKQLPNEARPKQKHQRTSTNDQLGWPRSFQQRQSHGNVQEGDRKLSSEFNDGEMGRIYSPDQLRRYPGRFRERMILK